MRAKTLFFDSNPIGRIFTRFSKDIAIMDHNVIWLTIMSSFGIFRSITVAMTICMIHPYMILVVLFVAYIMVRIMKYVVSTLTEAMMMDSVYRGPIHSNFTNVIDGLVSLRTYERLSYFREGFIDKLEQSCNITFTFFSINRWMCFVLDQICLIFTLAVACFSIYAKNKVDSDQLAFAL